MSRHIATNHDPLVTQFIPGPWDDPIALRVLVEARIRHAYPFGMGYWFLFTPPGFIGWFFVAPKDLHSSEIEIGWRLIRAAWSQGALVFPAWPRHRSEAPRRFSGREGAKLPDPFQRRPGIIAAAGQRPRGRPSTPRDAPEVDPTPVLTGNAMANHGRLVSRRRRRSEIAEDAP
jgi:hypothetical protein